MSKKSEVVYGDPSLAYLFEEDQDENREKLEELYDSYDINVVAPGDIIDAKLAGESKDDFLFDANCKDYIRVSRNHTEFNFIQGHKVGDVLPVLVEYIESPYLIKGSVASLYEARVREELRSLDPDEHITAFVKELTPAGYDMKICHGDVFLDAFMPHTLAGINKLHDEARKDLVGQYLEVMIESYSADKGTYIVSRRKYLKSLIPHEMKKLDNQTVYTGHVTGTTPFGVFVEFNDCLTGMIHKSNIHPEWRDKIQDIEPGTIIDFYVKEIINNKKIILTQIQKESLWDTIQVGQVIEGTVRDNKNFGALVTLDSETMGLIHTSELEKCGKSFSKGDKVEVKVLAVDRMNRKIFLRVV